MYFLSLWADILIIWKLFLHYLQMRTGRDNSGLRTYLYIYIFLHHLYSVSLKYSFTFFLLQGFAIETNQNRCCWNKLDFDLFFLRMRITGTCIKANTFPLKRKWGSLIFSILNHVSPWPSKSFTLPFLNVLVKLFRFSGTKYNFMHFERRNAFQNAFKLYFFQKKVIKRNQCAYPT